MQAQSTYVLRLYAFHECFRVALVALLDTCYAVTAPELRFNCGFIRTQSHGAHFVHAQSEYCRMTFYNMIGDPIVTYEDIVAAL